MRRVRRFLIEEFTKNFIMIFFPFLSILSIIYVIRIASFSQRINVSAPEMFDLFILFLPDILFYTLPASFVVALGATFLKLSRGNELISLFSYGLSPARILRFFIIPATLFSILLLLLSMIIIPQSTHDFKAMKTKKIADAQLAVEANKLGQKFGKFIFFAKEKHGDKLNDVILFTKTKDNKKIILIANEGKIKNQNGVFRLDLMDGSGDTFMPNSVKSLKYDEMSIYHYTKSKHKANKIQKWKDISHNKRSMSRFVYNIFISLTPILSLLLIAGLSIINPRYQKSSIYLVSFFVLAIVYTLGSALKESGTYVSFVISIFSFLAISVWVFYKRVRSTF